MDASPDTVYTEHAALKMYSNCPERALQIIDSAVIVGNLSDDKASFLRAKVYSRSLPFSENMDTAIHICESLMRGQWVEEDTFLSPAGSNIIAPLALSKV